jgi:uncharacterized metal-binding protein YceD (DUF177 family)
MTTYEFSRPFPTDKLRDRQVQEKIEATQEECEALAARLEIVAIKDFRAVLDMQRVHSGATVEVKGLIDADVVQNCVVTLEPFESHIREEVEAYFVKPETIPDVTEVDVEDDRSPEPIGKDGEIDLGELAAQHLSLALDPYPRKPGAVFDAVKVSGNEEPVEASPFAVLAEFKAPSGASGKPKGKK